MADLRRRHSSYKNAKRRAEAITFLSNISLSGKVEKRHYRNTKQGRQENVVDSDSKEEDGDFEVRPNVVRSSFQFNVTVTATASATAVSIPNVESSPTTGTPVRPKSVSVTSVRPTFRQRNSASATLNSPTSLTFLPTEIGVHETPTSSTSSKLRRTLSSSRTRRMSGGTTPPPSSPTKGSSHSNHEEFQHVITVRKLSSLESPPEGVELDFSKPRINRSFGNGRVVLVTSHKVPFAIWSHLRYKRTSHYAHVRRDSEALPRPRVGSVVLRSRLLQEPQDVPPITSTLAGVELGGEGKTVSYSHMLVPTLNSSSQAVRKLTVQEGILVTSPGLTVGGGAVTHASVINEREVEPSSDLSCQHMIYDPNKLDDPELISGKHKKLFEFSSYRVSVIDYAKPAALKRDINEKFKARYPGIDLTLSKLRSIKREMKKVIVDECELDPGVLAPAYVYFEKLVLFEKVNKDNRKLLAGVCLLLSAKLNDIKGAELQTLIKEVEDTFRESRKDLFAFEFPVLVALEFALHIPTQEVMPHYVRLMQT